MSESAATGKPEGGLRRGALTDFVAAHRLPWELSMGLLAIIYLIIGIAVDAGENVPEVVLGSLGVVFLLEFLLRFLDSPSRLRYLRGHWLDLISCIPLIGGTRSLRLLRLFRLGAGMRVIGLAEVHASHRQQRRDSLWFISPLMLVLWFGAATAYWELEHGINAGLHNFGDSLYWAFITSLTVGYGSGDVRPVTKEGQILSGFLIFLGIGLIGFLSSRLTARLLDVHDDHHEKHAEKLHALEGRLGHIESLLETLVSQQTDEVTPTTPRVRRSSRTLR